MQVALCGAMPMAARWGSCVMGDGTTQPTGDSGSAPRRPQRPHRPPPAGFLVLPPTDHVRVRETGDGARHATRGRAAFFTLSVSRLVYPLVS